LGASSPANGAFVSCALAQPAILSLAYDDSQSGLDVNSVVLTLDGQPAALPIDAATTSGLTFALPNMFPEGPHTWSVSVADLAGNVATFNSTFSVDNTAPTIEFMYPTDTVVLSDPLSFLNGGFSDGAGVGIDWNSFSLIINNMDYSNNATILGNTFYLNPGTPLSGELHIQILLNDFVGNQLQYSLVRSPALLNFGFESSPGVFTNISTPDALSIWQPMKAYTFRMQYASGVDVNSLSVTAIDSFTSLNVPTQVTTNQGDGFLYFTVGGVDSPTIINTTLTISDSAHTNTFTYTGSLTLVDPTATPQIYLDPSFSIGPTHPLSAVVYDTIPLLQGALYVNGQLVYTQMAEGVDAGTLSISYNPNPPLTLGPIVVTLAVTDLIGNIYYGTATYLVQDDQPPSIYDTTDNGYTHTTTPVISFLAFDNPEGSGVSAQNTIITYTVNGFAATVVPDATPNSDGSISFSYQFINAFSSGTAISYVIQTQDLAVPPNVAIQNGSFIIAAGQPIITYLSPATGNIPLDTSSFTFDIEDPIAITSVFGTLAEISTGNTIAFYSGATSGQQSLTLNVGTSLQKRCRIHAVAIRVRCG